MIIINLSPVFSSEYVETTIEVYKDLIIINGEHYDFTELPNSYHINAVDIGSDWFVDTVYKDDNGDLKMVIRFPHPYDADEKMRFPETIIVTKDGVVNLPKYTPPIVIEYKSIEVLENEENRLLEITTNTDVVRLESDRTEAFSDDILAIN